MIPSFKYLIRALTIVMLMLFLFSCSSYNRQIAGYYTQMVNSDYEKAFTEIDHIKKLQVSRNKLLYLFEKGKMSHLMGEYDSSNAYFNEADLYIEDARSSAKDVAIGLLLNPMMQTYKAEDFEKFMVHYYKALNYLYLGKRDDALVEARRISLQSFNQQDKNGNRNNKYSDDAFSLILQGLIYEQDGDVGNAFISYRNAADIFLKNDNSYYGVSMPLQLRKDLLRTASQNGYTDELNRYEKLFNIDYHQSPPDSNGGELVLFWENGLAPVKVEQNFFFALNKDAGGNFFFTDNRGAFSIPFDAGNYNNVNRDQLSASDLRSFRVAFPRYEEQPVFYRSAAVTLYNKQYSLEPAQDINTLAFATLKERFLKEMSITLSRLAVKKIAEAALRPKNDTAKNKDAQEAIALAVQAFNFLSEKADTRNWQSLPHTIYYTRMPLKKGPNSLTLALSSAGTGSRQVVLNVEGNGSLQVRNICTLVKINSP